MLNFDFLEASGPCLVAVETALALIFVHRRLSRVPHALAWALSFAAAAVQIVLTVLGVRLLATTFGLAAVLLFVDGFRVRATGQWPSRARIAAGVGLIAILAAAVAVLGRLGEVAVLAVSATLLAGAARRIIPRERRASLSEVAVLVMLVLLGLWRAVEIVFAAAGNEGAYQSLINATWTPRVAASGLFVLLLIASDFSIELRRVLHTDPLTGVLTRSGFEQAAGEMLKRARQRVQPITLAIADIDRFKLINDRFGHAVGDEALTCVAGHLTSAAGRDDLVGRIGGEEFALMLWATDEMGAQARIDPVRSSLPGTCATVQPDIHVTISLGIAVRHGEEELRPLLDRADRALYRSKREGRDRTTLAGAPA